MGHYVLSVASLGEGPPGLVRGPKSTASYLARASVRKRPDLANDGLPLPLTEDVLYRFEPPQTFSARNAVTLGGARAWWLSETEKIVWKLLAHQGPASARQPKRVNGDSDGGETHLATSVDEALEHCKVHRNCDEAPRTNPHVVLEHVWLRMKC